MSRLKTTLQGQYDKIIKWLIQQNWFYDNTTDSTKKKKNTQDFKILYLDIHLKNCDNEPLF